MIGFIEFFPADFNPQNQRVLRRSAIGTTVYALGISKMHSKRAVHGFSGLERFVREEVDAKEMRGSEKDFSSR
ncbi:MAG: hypothetical protein ACOC0K_01535 [bacterium]